MIIWFIFIVFECLLLLSYNKTYDSKKRKYILFFITITIIYFAGFRDCLGMDYNAYRDLCERDRALVFNKWWLTEPIVELVRLFCYETKFSAVIFFVFMAIITTIPTFFVYSKSDNFSLCVFIYLTYTGIYLFSFNIVRQFAAAGLCMLAAYFLLKEKNFHNILYYIILIIIASFIHKSAIIFLLTIFISVKNYNPSLLAFTLIISFFLPISSIPGFDILNFAITALDYETYLDYDTFSVSKTSIVNIYLHIIILILLSNKKKILELHNSKQVIFSLKMFVLFLLCNNLSANGFPIAYRLGCLFVLFIPLAMSIIPRIISKSIGYLILIPPLIFLFFFVGLSNPLVVPDRILPLSSIFDFIYKKY